MKIKTEYANRLPHIAPIGATFFITFRLADSLPYHVVKQLKAEREAIMQKLRKEKPKGYQLEIIKEQKRFFKYYDRELDHNPRGVCQLKQAAIATVVKDKLHKLDGDKYVLLSYCIMPNHVHLLLDMSIQLQDTEGNFRKETPEEYVQLSQIMQSIKGGTAYEANKLLGRKGTFWQKDSYDHYIRNQKELSNVVNYIAMNPVKAKLVERFQDFSHTYIHSGFL